MGMRTILYGYIEEMDFWQNPIKDKVMQYNTQVIHSLRKGDDWPPLSREMFAICENSTDIFSPDLAYSGRIIHFGANLKSVEYELAEWIVKFEALLSKLLWLEARVHFKTEYAELQTLSWRVDLEKYKIAHDHTFPPSLQKEYWVFASTWE